MKTDLNYSTRGLNEAGNQIEPGANTPEKPVASAALLEILKNFAGIPSVDLVDVDASISLKAKGQEFIVSNESGQLYMVQAPAATNSAVARSAEEIVQFLDDEFTPAQAEEKEEVVITTGKTRDNLGSPKMLVGLLAVWAVIAYFTLAPDELEGVEIIDDSARQESFAQRIEGRYGVEDPPGEAVFVVQDGRVKVYLTSEEGVDTEPALDEAFSFGQRDGDVVLVIANGAILSLDATGALVFEDEVYPRIP